MKYINQFTSIEDYITYKENNIENLPGVNRAIENNISTTVDDYPNSFVFIDDENNTNYNIIRLKSHRNNTQIPNNLNTVYNKCIYDNNSGDYVTTIITKNYLYNPLTEIPDNAFAGSNMVNIDLPETIKKIGNYAFENTFLESITLNENISHIGNYAFANTNLQSITLNENISYIGNNAFERTYLESIILNKNISYVGNNAFNGCEYLTDIEFKNTSSIVLGKNILNGCELINNITFYSTNPPIFDNIGSNDYLFYDDSTAISNFYKTITLPITYNYEDWFELLSRDKSFSIDKIRHDLDGGTQTIYVNKVFFETEEIKRIVSVGNIIQVYIDADTETIDINYTYDVQNVYDNLLDTPVTHAAIPLQLKKVIGTNENCYENTHDISLSYNNCTKSVQIRQSAPTPINQIFIDNDKPENRLDNYYSDVAYHWEKCDNQPFYFKTYNGKIITEPYTGLPLLMFKSKNIGIQKSTAMMAIKISNTSSFTFYILNHGVGEEYDYIKVSKPSQVLLHSDEVFGYDDPFTYDITSVNEGEVRFTTFENFKEVNIDSLDPSKSYYIYIAHEKDGTGNYSGACGYVLLPMYEEDIFINDEYNIWGDDHCQYDDCDNNCYDDCGNECQDEYLDYDCNFDYDDQT